MKLIINCDGKKYPVEVSFDTLKNMLWDGAAYLDKDNFGITAKHSESTEEELTIALKVLLLEMIQEIVI